MKKQVTSLTPFERLTLRNQLTMLKKVDPDNAEDYDEQIAVLRSVRNDKQ